MRRDWRTLRRHARGGAYYPYLDHARNNVQNGIALRVDVHLLFNIGFLTVDAHYRVRVSPRVSSPAYEALNGHRIRLPSQVDFALSPEALEYHRVWVFRTDGWGNNYA